MRVQVCAMRRNIRMSDNAMLGKGRAVLIPASRRSGPSAITCVSNGLTGGTGSGFIDGGLGMF